MCGPQCNEGPRSRCFTLGLRFHVGFRVDFLMFFMLFRVGFMSVMLGALKLHNCFENGRTPQVSLRSRPWRGLNKIRCFMSGWVFMSGLRVPEFVPRGTAEWLARVDRVR